ncbi:nucleoside monophosphate kinase [Candidatus Woesearchaeota archaeon]|nr:nucleoside monophosphate kinase [Candidatus Woesearchaeota archaeon]
MRIVILGPQGSGKGTQANLLSKKFKLPHIDAGQLLRDEVEKGSVVGKKIKLKMERGELIDPEIAPEIIRKRLSKADCKKGFVLDGFPRDIGQAKSLEKITRINVVVELKVSDVIAVKRLTNRWQCMKCDTIYGITIPPKKAGFCDKCGGKLIKRKDDTAPLIKKRLKVYHNVTEPVIDYFKKQNKVVSVDASKPVGVAFKQIIASLK